jgi:DNA-binding NarL/FixJ family response regulator
MFLICSYLPEPYPNAARLLAAIPSSALLWWRLLHKTDDLRPDLVLMDIRLARGTDGIQAAGEIRTRFDIASLYLSAHTDAATLNRAQATQPLGFIAKPYTHAQLEAALRAAVTVLRGGPVQ